ncbi:MAG: hypothetical protein ACOYMS_02595 [Terrimicrobiaceae bacterium]
MPEKEDPFEIAKRLDEFGAGRGPRPAKAEIQPKSGPKNIVKRKQGLSTWTVLVLIVLVAILGWLLFQRGGADFGFLRPPTNPPPKQSTVPLQSNPPKTIPAADGNGEVPAFTVQTPGPNTPAARDSSEQKER